MLKFEFHKFSCVTKHYFSFDILQSFKYIITFLAHGLSTNMQEDKSGSQAVVSRVNNPKT